MNYVAWHHSSTWWLLILISFYMAVFAIVALPHFSGGVMVALGWHNPLFQKKFLLVVRAASKQGMGLCSQLTLPGSLEILETGSLETLTSPAQSRCQWVEWSGLKIVQAETER